MFSLIFNRDKFIAAIIFSQTAIFFRETDTTFFASITNNVGITNIPDGLHITYRLSFLNYFRSVGRIIKSTMAMKIAESARIKFCSTLIAIGFALFINNHLFVKKRRVTDFAIITDITKVRAS